MAAATATTTAVASPDDERLARQLQANEFQMAGRGGAPMPTAGMAMRGQPVMMQGMVVQGQPVGGMAPGPYGQWQPGPYGAYPAIGNPMGMNGMPAPVTVMQVEATPEELTILRYRCSIMCFACIDAASTLLYAFSSLTIGFSDTERSTEEKEEAGSLFGMKGANTGLDPKILGIVQLLFLAGPLCGYWGSRTIKRAPLGVYLGFCLAKMSFSIAMAAIGRYWWYIVIALIQMYITKIVFSFWKALGTISPERCMELLRPEFVVGRPVTMAYW